MELPCPSFSNDCLIQAILLAVDFVLESGNGELDNTVDLSIGTQPLADGLGFGDNPPTPSPDTPKFPSTAHGFDTLNHNNNADKSQGPVYYRIAEGHELSPKQRSWPLRDPEEAFLLKHFVDRTSSFVSESLHSLNWFLPLQDEKSDYPIPV